MAITMALYFNLIVFLMFIASIGIGMQYNPTILLSFCYPCYILLQLSCVDDGVGQTYERLETSSLWGQWIWASSWSMHTVNTGVFQREHSSFAYCVSSQVELRGNYLGFFLVLLPRVLRNSALYIPLYVCREWEESCNNKYYNSWFKMLTSSSLPWELQENYVD